MKDLNLNAMPEPTILSNFKAEQMNETFLVKAPWCAEETFDNCGKNRKESSAFNFCRTYAAIILQLAVLGSFILCLILAGLVTYQQIGG